MQKLLPLTQIFSDNIEYAWNLLQAQMKIQLNQQISSEEITQMIQLYMRGVEKMNSVSDPRESYFTIKMSTMMSRKNVIKALNNKAMAKKNKRSQVIKSKPIQQQKIVLNEKKKELQMRMAYVVEDNNNHQLKMLINENMEKQKKVCQKINNIIASHEERLMQRIRKRQLKTNTVRSSVNQQNQPNQQSSNKKNTEEIFNQLELKIKTTKKTNKNQSKCISMTAPEINTQFYDQGNTPKKFKPRRQTLDLSQL